MFDYRAYYDLINPKYITWDFYKNYTTKEPPFGQLGLVVFLRTYSRYIPELNRREKWCETILRATEYSLSLEDKHSTLKRTTIDKRIEAETLFDKLYKMEGFLAGRTYWIGGTKAVEKHNSASFNCSACSINTISSFAEGLYWLLLGAGFGFSIENKYIKQLPKFYLNKVVNHIKLDSYEGLLEHTQIKVIEKDKNVIVTSLTIDDLNRDDKSFNKLFGKKPKKVTIKVGDSKEGWTTAFRTLLILYTIKSVSSIEIDYSFIRKEGERLKTFGGRSSGYLPLMQHFERVIEVINQNKNLLNNLLGKKLTSVEVLDILNSMGLAVVVSGIRRSSELALGDKTDNNFINAKLNLFTDESKANKRATRVMSNNSVALYSNPGLNYFKQLMQSIKSNGEPGLIIVGNMQKKHPTRGVVNPCFSPETMVLTKQGHYPIVELVGKTVDVWDGNQWVTVDNFRITGTNVEVYDLELENNIVVRATANHKFVLDDDTEVELINLKPGDELKTSKLIDFDLGILLRLNLVLTDYVVKRITKVGLIDHVYCCTVPTNNRFTLTNGLLVGNCSEICLDPTGGTCNLVEGNAFNHLIKTKNGFNFNWSSWEETLTLITRACSRVTLPNLWHERWDYIQKRDRLLGVSITGLMDTYDALKWNDADLEHFFRFSKEIVKKVYSKYHDELNINRPLLATTIKPSGTVSQLPTVSSGIHRSYSPYYQRRIRVSKQDPIALALLNMGIPVSPENGQGDDIRGDKCNTWVFSFVVKTAATMRSIDEPAIEQLNRYKSSMRHWTDHNTSITVSVDENEWNLIPEWLYNNYDDVIGISFLPKFDTENSPYPQMPYECINEDKYNELSKELPKLTEEKFIELIAKYEKPDEEFDLGSDCNKGSCPIR